MTSSLLRCALFDGIYWLALAWVVAVAISIWVELIPKILDPRARTQPPDPPQRPLPQAYLYGVSRGWWGEDTARKVYLTWLLGRFFTVLVMVAIGTLDVETLRQIGDLYPICEPTLP